LPSADDVFGGDTFLVANRLATRSPYLHQTKTGVVASLAKQSRLDSLSLERKKLRFSRKVNFSQVENLPLLDC